MKHQAVARPRLVYLVPLVAAIALAIIFGVQKSRATGPAGFKSMRLSDEDRLYTVGTRTANGAVVVSHVFGKTAAERFVAQGSAGTTAKEVSRER